MKSINIHRGELLKRIVESSDLSKTVIIKKAGYKSRSSYYTHIETKDLPLDILAKYGKAVDYDFSIDIPEMKTMESFLENESPQTIQQAIKERDYWRDKYYNLLEKNNELLQIMAKQKNKR